MEANGINVAAIERELTALWKQAGEEEDSGVVRASQLNLLVFTPGASVPTELEEVITDVTAAHPCRAIIMAADRAADRASLTADVTSRCVLAPGMAKQVCCEEVRIHAAGASVAEVPSAVVPLLISDLPVYLWWRAVPQLLDRVFKRLVDIADRVVIDSARFAEPQADLMSLSVILRDSPRWTAFSDLNWARLTPWRALLAGFYDVAQYRACLADIRRVVIEYAPPAEDRTAVPPKAMLMAGWLASRLQWQLDTDAVASGTHLTSFGFESKTGPVRVELIPTARQIEPGHLAAVTLEADSQSPASFSVNRAAEGDRIETMTTFGEERQIQRVLSYVRASESELIGREMGILSHDRVYEQAVLAAGDMIVALV